MPLLRLDRIISEQTGVSRRDAKELIAAGRVSVDGAVAMRPEHKADAEASEIALDGRRLIIRQFIYIMMNKPAGVVSATEDTAQKTVLDLLPENLRKRGLFPAGRLDKDTTGLLIITDDGGFGHRLTAPKSNIDKTYLVTAARTVSAEGVRMIKDGLVLRDGSACLPAVIIAKSEAPPVYEVTICQGMYHQIKRMFAAAGSHVEKLERISIGGLVLDKNLVAGQFREIEENELKLALKPRK